MKVFISIVVAAVLTELKPEEPSRDIGGADNSGVERWSINLRMSKSHLLDP